MFVASGAMVMQPLLRPSQNPQHPKGDIPMNMASISSASPGGFKGLVYIQVANMSINRQLIMIITANFVRCSCSNLPSDDLNLTNKQRLTYKTGPNLTEHLSVALSTYNRNYQSRGASSTRSSKLRAFTIYPQSVLFQR